MYSQRCFDFLRLVIYIVVICIFIYCFYCDKFEVQRSILRILYMRMIIIYDSKLNYDCVLIIGNVS